MHHKIRLITAVIILLAAVSTACTRPTTATPPPPVCLDLDPIFRELFDQLGGIETLGCPISPSFTYKDPSTNRELLCQYTAATLLVYDPYGNDSLKRRLAPIGVQMGIAQPAVPHPEDPGVRWVEGHVIYDPFVPLYERLGGMRYVGKPLTEVRYNPDRRRYEQYFENVGMYILDFDETKTPGLLAYGAWMCDSNCRAYIPHNSTHDNDIGELFKIAPEFVDTVSRLGSDFTGFALSDAYDTPDGYREQVYDNIVLVSNPNQPGMVFLRGITPIIGIMADPLAARSPDPESFFYAVQGDLGYNIPKQFYDYIVNHGGLEVSGPPISERKAWNNDIFRQCFVNLCLEEDPKEHVYRRIQPSQLGATYGKFPVPPVTSTPPGEQQAQAAVQAAAPVSPAPVQAAVQPAPQTSIDAQTPSQISIRPWVTYPMVAPNQAQEVGVMVYENGAPMAGIEPDITITLADGNTRTYYMYPTGADGQSRLQIEPIDAPNMTLIPYEVCIFLLGGQKLCVQDTFMIHVTP